MIFSSDTNIWIDFDTLGILAIPFKSTHVFHMSRDAIEDELLAPQGLNSTLCALGLKTVDFDLDEFYLAENYQSTYPRLSRYDALAMAIAKQRSWILLTGDAAMRAAAQREHIDFKGTLWLLDDLMDAGIIDRTQYRQILVDIQKFNGREIRLPKSEITQRLMDIETYNHREKMLELREELLAVEEDRATGRTDISIDELDAYLDEIIGE